MLEREWAAQSQHPSSRVTNFTFQHPRGQLTITNKPNSRGSDTTQGPLSTQRHTHIHRWFSKRLLWSGWSAPISRLAEGLLVQFCWSFYCGSVSKQNVQESKEESSWEENLPAQCKVLTSNPRAKQKSTNNDSVCKEGSKCLTKVEPQKGRCYWFPGSGVEKYYSWDPRKRTQGKEWGAVRRGWVWPSCCRGHPGSHSRN